MINDEDRETLDIACRNAVNKKWAQRIRARAYFGSPALFLLVILFTLIIFVLIKTPDTNEFYPYVLLLLGILYTAIINLSDYRVQNEINRNPDCTIEVPQSWKGRDCIDWCKIPSCTKWTEKQELLYKCRTREKQLYYIIQFMNLCLSPYYKILSVIMLFLFTTILKNLDVAGFTEVTTGQVIIAIIVLVGLILSSLYRAIILWPEKSDHAKQYFVKSSLFHRYYKSFSATFSRECQHESWSSMQNR